MAGLALACGGVMTGRQGSAWIEKWTQRVLRVWPSGFGLHLAGAAEASHDRTFTGSVFYAKEKPARWYGTYVRGDAFVGEVVSTPFLIGGDNLLVPIIGYPHLEGNRLELEVVDRAGTVVGRIAYEGENPTESPRVWRVETGKWRGLQGRLRLIDHTTKVRGWLGVGVPHIGGPEVAWLKGVPRNYGWFALAAGALTALLLVPGFSIRTWAGGRLPFVYVPLPGLLGLALLGLLTWRFGPGAMQPWGKAWLGVNALAALGLTGQWWRTGKPWSRAEGRLLGAYACVVMGALAFGVLPAEVGQEYDTRSTAQGRMIASPPDHELPYQTAVYFYHGKNGREDRGAYFSDSWSVGSRGPLAPLAITAAFVIFDEHPNDPPGKALNAWPASADGFYLARITGILTNALAVMGAGLLAAALLGRLSGVAIAAVAVAPVVAINVDFLWPKLLATYFLLLAIGVLVRRRLVALAAIFTALAYYSHPVGGLFAPAVALFIAWRALLPREGATTEWRCAIRQTAGFGATLVACLVPWLAYKVWLGFPDVFLKYPMGDGWGLNAANSLATWLHCRWSNLWVTVTPGGFFWLTPFMRGWIWGPLSEPLRWGISYAKTLPGALGYPLYGVAVYAVVAKRQLFPRGFLTTLGLGAFALMLVFWGFSGDGLGRNCLEPLAMLLVVVAAVAGADRPKLMKWLLVVTALETASIRIIGVVYAPSFATVPAKWETIGLAAVALVALFWPLRYVWQRDADEPGAA